MKKFSKCLKRTFLIVLPALLMGSLSVGALHDIKPVAAEEVSSSESPIEDIDNDFYTLEKTGDHAVTLLFNANPKVYKNIRKDDITTLIDELKNVLKDVVQTKITELSEETIEIDVDEVKGTTEDKPDEHASVIPIYPGQIQVYHDLTTYISLQTYANLLVNYANYLPGSTLYHDITEITPTVVLAYAHLYVKNYLIENGLESNETTRRETFSDFCAIVANRISDKFGVSASDFYSYMYAAGDAIINDDYVLTLNQVSGMLVLIKDKSETGVDNLGVRDLITTVGGTRVKEEILELVRTSGLAEMSAFLNTVPENVVAVVMTEIDFDRDDLYYEMDERGIAFFIELAGEVGVGKTKLFIESVKDFDTDDFIARVTEKATPKDIWKSVKNIYVDDVKVVDEKQISMKGLKKLFKRLPSLETMSTMEDDKWRHEFHIVLDTTVEEVTLDLTLGFKGDCKWIRKAAKIINDHLTITKTDGTWNIEINLPEFISSMYRYLIESEILSDDLKRELWDFAFGTVEEGYQYLHWKTLEDLKEMASDVEYKILFESIVSADELNEFFGISRLNQDQIDRLINLVFKAINKGQDFNMDAIYEIIDEFYQIDDDLKDQIDKVVNKIKSLLSKIAKRNYDASKIHDYLFRHSDEEINNKINDEIDRYLDKGKVVSLYNRFQRYLEKVYDRIPARFRDKSIMDFYRGKGVWSGKADATIDIKKWVRKIPKVGEKIADAMAGFIDELPSYFDVHVTINGKGLYGISYHNGDDVKTGALPVDVSDATFFAGIDTVRAEGVNRNIVAWADLVDAEHDTYEYLTSMPKHDVQAYPIYFTESADIERTYDGTSSTLEVTPNIETGHSFVYQWYKDGEKLNGETASSIEVTNASQSGDYVCKINGIESQVIHVTIARAVVDRPVQTVALTYDGSEQFYYDSFGKSQAEAEEFYIPVDGEISAVEPGEHFVELSLKDPSNYVWDNGSGNNYQFSYTIDKAVITITPEMIEWNYVNPYTYDGEAKTVTLNEELLPEGVQVTYSNNVKTKAGSYSAHALLSLKPEYSAHYVLEGTTAYKRDWVINKATIIIPNNIGLIQDTFEHDGHEHTAKLDESLLPNGPCGVTVVYGGDQTKTEIGDYTLQVSYLYDFANCELQPGYQTEFNWKITPRMIDISLIAWDYTGAFTYDGNLHMVRLLNIPTGVHVEYSGDLKATNVGTYTAQAVVTPQRGSKLVKDGQIIEEDEATYTLSWSIVRGEPVVTQKEFYSEETSEDGTSLVWVSASKEIEGEYTLHAEEVDYKKYNFDVLTNTGTVEVVTCYDINVYNKKTGDLVDLNVDKKGEIIDPSLSLKIRILVPESYREGHTLKMCHVTKDGEVVALDGVIEGQYMTYSSQHLSIYALTEAHVAGSNIVPYIVVGATGALLTQATGSILLVVLAKRRRRTIKE